MEKLNLLVDQKQYGNKVILKNICQVYEKIKIHGVLGENGAGKTTLFHCMAGLIRFKGKRMFSETINLGYLPAELYMYSMITGEEFLRFYVTAKGRRYDADEKTRLNDFFDLPLNEYAETYSTGMLKKLYLLALLLQHNDILLLDEPFNGLDFVSSAFITAMLKRQQESGKTIFVASHDLDHLFSFADTISVIKDCGLTFYSGRNEFLLMKKQIEEEARMKAMAALKSY